MDIAKTFVSKFHNLEGTTIGEKRKHFFQLLHTHSQLHQNEKLLEIITPQLTPQTHFERVCFIDFLIYFRRQKELFNEFLKGNDVVVSKLSKQRWFFEKIYQGNSNEFINQFLPTLSFSLRIKILKKLVLVLNEQQSDELFDALLERYGVFIALNVLTSCSIPKIEEVMVNHPVKLWISQLKILYNRKPDLMYLYAEERVKHDGNYSCLNNCTILRFIAARDPEMYCNLQEKYKFNVYGSIGKRSTKRIVRLKKNSIMARPELFVCKLHSAQLVRNMGKDFHVVYSKMFPKKIESVFTPWQDIANSRLLPHYVKSRQFELFQQTFSRIFCDPLELAWGSSMNSNYSTFMMGIITNGEEREKWARLKLNEKESQWLKYFTTPSCLEVIKPKFKFSAIGKQIEYVRTVTECCLVNKDWNALLDLCQLLCDTNRTDDKSVHSKLLELLSSQRVFENLTEAHWKYLQIIIGKAESSLAAPAIFQYFAFMHRHATVREDVLVQLLKEVKWVASLNHLVLDKTIERELLLLLIKLAPEICEDSVVKADLHLVVACRDFSKHHSREKIQIFDHPRLVQSLKDSVKVEEIEEDVRKKAFEWVITKHPHDNELIEIFWANFHLLVTKKLIFWFLKHNPTKVASNMTTFLTVVLKEMSFNFDYKEEPLLWKAIKSYSHLKMDQMVVDFCLTKLNDDDFDNKTLLADPLALLMPPIDFIKLVESFKPTSPTVDLTDTVLNDRFQLQRKMLKAFVHLTAPQEILPVILDFMSGDYVASCLSPLHSSLYQYPENAVSTILDKICAIGAVSVKKHGFYLICITQKETSILEAVERCSLSQSIAMAYQHFIKNPSKSSWGLVTTKLQKLDNNDHFTCLLLVNTPAPKNYKGRYFEAAYEVFKTKENRFLNVLVDKLQEEVIGELSTRFFTTIQDDFLRMNRSDFLVSCLLLFSSEESKLEIVVEGLRRFKQRSWSLQSHEAKEKLNKFVMTFSTLYMESKKHDPPLVASFAEEFSKIFKSVEAFEEHIILSLIQFKNESNADLSRSIINLHNRLIGTYGKLIFNIFAASVIKIFPKFLPEESCRFQFYCNLLNFGQSTEDALLVIKLVPMEKPQLKETAENYYKTLEVLRGGNETVQLHLCRKCKLSLTT